MQNILKSCAKFWNVFLKTATFKEVTGLNFKQLQEGFKGRNRYTFGFPQQFRVFHSSGPDRTVCRCHFSLPHFRETQVGPADFLRFFFILGLHLYRDNFFSIIGDSTGLYIYGFCEASMLGRAVAGFLQDPS
jgi:hypothetical protein